MVEIGGYVTEPNKIGKFQDGTPRLYGISLLWDRVISKSISRCHYQPMVIKIDIVIESYLITNIFEGSPDWAQGL